MSRNARIALLGAALVVAVAAFLIAKPGGDGDDTPATNASTTTQPTATADSPTTATTTPAPPKPPPVPIVKVSGGQPVGPLVKMTFKRGEFVRFVVESDAEDQIHIHGYDIEKDVPEGGRITFAFRADKDGIFEVESHSAETQVAELRVEP